MTFYDDESLDKFKKELESRGYKYFDNDARLDHYDYMYQKCFRDELGKRYFIDIRFYDFTKFYNFPQNWSCSAEVYFRDNKELHSEKSDKNYFDKWESYPENYTNVDIKFEDIDTLESFVQKLFWAMGFEYYEKYDEC